MPETVRSFAVMACLLMDGKEGKGSDADDPEREVPRTPDERQKDGAHETACQQQHEQKEAVAFHTLELKGYLPGQQHFQNAPPVQRGYGQKIDPGQGEVGGNAYLAHFQQEFPRGGVHEKFRRSNQAFLRSKKDNYNCMGNFMAWNLFFQGMMYLVTLVFGGWLIAKGLMEPVDLAMYALYIGIFINPIQILVELIEMMQKGLAGFRRFLEVMDTAPEIKDPPDARELTDVKGRVSYEDVSFHYSDDDTPVLSHVSFEIPAGRSIALVGPSGSGKTTICSLLPRFYDVTGGWITIDGKDVRTLSLKSLRSQIGMVQQDVYLFSGTIRDNIAYGRPGASMDEIIEAARRANIHDFISELPDGYDTFVGERGARLSGGQKQRISIARVFLKNPPILILDEATSALDNESERWIQQSLEELSRDRTTITIAHRLSTIRNADEIIVITEDGIAERGTHESLLAKGGIYAHYYNL